MGSVRYGSTNQANLAFRSIWVGKWVIIHAITWIPRVNTIKRQTGAAYGCVVAGSNPVAAGLAYGLYRLYARSVCDTHTTAPLQLQLPIVALYKCYAYTSFTHVRVSSIS